MVIFVFHHANFYQLDFSILFSIYVCFFTFFFRGPINRQYTKEYNAILHNTWYIYLYIKMGKYPLLNGILKFASKWILNKWRMFLFCVNMQMLHQIPSSQVDKGDLHNLYCYIFCSNFFVRLNCIRSNHKKKVGTISSN